MAEPEITLYYEDVPTIDGRVVSETEWTEPIPLMVMPEAESEGHDGAQIIGALTGIRRSGEAVVGTPSISLEPYRGLACEPDFDHVDPEALTGAGGKVLMLRGVRLRAVTLGHGPVWAGLEIGERDA